MFRNRSVVLLQIEISAGYPFSQNPRIALGPQDAKTEPITRQETLRGSITPEREWWDVLHYHLQVEFFTGDEKIERVEHDNFQDAEAGKENAD